MDSACYIGAGARAERLLRAPRGASSQAARRTPPERNSGVHVFNRVASQTRPPGATIAQLVDAVVRFLSGSMEVDSRHESKGEHKEEKFVNEGLIKWKEGRKKWLAAATSGQKRPRRRPPRVDDEVILETIFAKPTGWLLAAPRAPGAHGRAARRTSGPTRTGGAADLLHANQNTRRLFPARRTIVYVFTLGRHLDRRRLRLLRRRQQDLSWRCNVRRTS